MQESSSFGCLTAWFGAHPDNLATEGLNYIVHRSRVTKQALTRHICEGTWW
jgi:hypothetical protein